MNINKVKREEFLKARSLKKRERKEQRRKAKAEANKQSGVSHESQS